MVDENEDTAVPTDDKTVGQKLKEAREAQGLSHKEMAEKTRLPLRHVRNLETGDYAALPGTPYAIGFTRSYARVLGLDENAMVEQLRDELDLHEVGHPYMADDYSAADPSRIPPKFFTWGAIAILAIILIGYALLRGGDDEAVEPVTVNDNAELAETRRAGPPESEAEEALSGPVVLTANEDVWLRVYEEEGDRLFESRLQKGDSYTVPEDAENPLILTGRPQALDVTVGGREVPPLGRADYTIADFPISAEALAAREDNADGEDAAGDEGANE